MNAKQRKLEWDSLSQPKPDWESFKRLVGLFGSTESALKQWESVRRRSFAKTVDRDAPQRMVDEFIIFTDVAPIEMLVDFDSWVSA